MKAAWNQKKKKHSHTHSTRRARHSESSTRRSNRGTNDLLQVQKNWAQSQPIFFELPTGSEQTQDREAQEPAILPDACFMRICSELPKQHVVGTPLVDDDRVSPRPLLPCSGTPAERMCFADNRRVKGAGRVCMHSAPSQSQWTSKARVHGQQPT